MRSDGREELWRDVQRPPLRPEGRLVLVDSGQFSQIDRPEVVVAVLSVTAPALTQWTEIFWPASQREYIEAAGLMSYGPNFPELNRRAADYVDKIVRFTSVNRCPPP